MALPRRGIWRIWGWGTIWCSLQFTILAHAWMRAWLEVLQVPLGLSNSRSYVLPVATVEIMPCCGIINEWPRWHIYLCHASHCQLIPPLNFSFQELQFLRVQVTLAPLFADQPMKEMVICIGSRPIRAMVRQHWQGIVFPHVEHLKADRGNNDIGFIPIEFWREFLLNVKKVGWPRIFL